MFDFKILPRMLVEDHGWRGIVQRQHQYAGARERHRGDRKTRGNRYTHEGDLGTYG